MKSLHIICAKCGSAELIVRIERDLYSAGVDFVCQNCGENTSAEEIQEQLREENK